MTFLVALVIVSLVFAIAERVRPARTQPVLRRGVARDLAAAIIGTAWGHFNHANLKAHLGRFAYLVNGPEMHLWHHAHLDDTGGQAVNFGIIFSAWDWLFGTAVLPARPPERLGFPGVEVYPDTLAGQLAAPLAEPSRAGSPDRGPVPQRTYRVPAG